MITIIYAIPPSPNKWMKGKHFRIYMRLRDKWYILLLEALGRSKPKKRHIIITMYRTRLFDKYDNVYTSCKFIIDCLKRWIQIPGKRNPYGKEGLGWIEDDSGDECKIEIKQIKISHRKDEYTEIEIKDL